MHTWPTEGKRVSELNSKGRVIHLFKEKITHFPLYIRAWTSRWFKFSHNTWPPSIFMRLGIHNNLKNMLFQCHYLKNYYFIGIYLNCSIKDCTLFRRKERIFFKKLNSLPFLDRKTKHKIYIWCVLRKQNAYIGPSLFFVLKNV